MKPSGEVERRNHLSLIFGRCEIIIKPSQKQRVALETFSKKHLETLIHGRGCVMAFPLPPLPYDEDILLSSVVTFN